MGGLPGVIAQSQLQNPVGVEYLLIALLVAFLCAKLVTTT